MQKGVKVRSRQKEEICEKSALKEGWGERMTRHTDHPSTSSDEDTPRRPCETQYVIKDSQPALRRLALLSDLPSQPQPTCESKSTRTTNASRPTNAKRRQCRRDGRMNRSNILMGIEAVSTCALLGCGAMSAYAIVHCAGGRAAGLTAWLYLLCPNCARIKVVTRLCVHTGFTKLRCFTRPPQRPLFNCALACFLVLADCHVGLPGSSST